MAKLAFILATIGLYCHYSHQLQINDFTITQFDISLPRLKRQVMETEMSNINGTIEVPKGTQKEVQSQIKHQDKPLCQFYELPMCCGPKKELHPNSTIKQAMNQCLMKSFGDPSMFQLFYCSQNKEMHEKLTCVYECFGKKMNVIDKDGKLNEEVFLNVSLEMYRSEDWQTQFISDGVKAIIDELKRGNILNASLLHNSTCAPKVQSLVINFIWIYQQLQCPPPHVIKTNTCNVFLEKLKSQQKIREKLASIRKQLPLK